MAGDAEGEMCPAEDPMTRSQAAAQPVVLVVEDEIMVRIGVTALLRERGFNVVEAGNGGEAQTLILAGVKPDLIFSDISMPGLNGVALARWAAESGLDAAIVLTSGRPDSLDEARSACPHVRAFVTKPYEDDALVAQLRAVLSTD